MVEVIDIETKEQFEQIVRDNEIVMTDFWATWCGPCKYFASGILPKLAEEAEGIKIVKVDVDKVSDLATQFGISTVPTILFFKNKDVVNKFVGLHQKSELLKEIEEIKK